MPITAFATMSILRQRSALRASHRSQLRDRQPTGADPACWPVGPPQALILNGCNAHQFQSQSHSLASRPYPAGRQAAARPLARHNHLGADVQLEWLGAPGPSPVQSAAAFSARPVSSEADEGFATRRRRKVCSALHTRPRRYTFSGDASTVVKRVDPLVPQSHQRYGLARAHRQHTAPTRWVLLSGEVNQQPQHAWSASSLARGPALAGPLSLPLGATKPSAYAARALRRSTRPEVGSWLEMMNTPCAT